MCTTRKVETLPTALRRFPCEEKVLFILSAKRWVSRPLCVPIECRDSRSRRSRERVKSCFRFCSAWGYMYQRGRELCSLCLIYASTMLAFARTGSTGWHLICSWVPHWVPHCRFQPWNLLTGFFSGANVCKYPSVAAACRGPVGPRENLRHVT